MKTFLPPALFLALLLCWGTLPGQNNALDFDGDGDYITLSPINGFPTGPVSDFTVEMWFISTATGTTAGNCSGDFRRLFALGNPNNTSLFEVGECNGFLSLFWVTTSSGLAANLITTTTSIRDNQWHCLSVVRSLSSLEIFLDGNLVITDPTNIGTHNITVFKVGHGLANTTSPSPGEDWWGRMDEVKLWNIALPAAQLTACNNCMLTGQEPGLVAYWQFDQGLAGGNNSSSGSNPITQALDASVNGNHGVLHPSTATPDSGFVLNGLTGNFVTSGAPLVYPKYNNLGVFISDPLLTVGLIGICDGDPVHFSLVDYNTGSVPPPSAGVTVTWEYSDNGPWGPILSIPPLSGFQFVVPPNDATDINCPNNSGYVDRDFRAKITITNSIGTCVYYSQPSSLRIYCKVSNASVIVAPPGPFCAGDFALLNVSLASTDPFVLPNIGSTVTVEWFLNGTWLGSGYTNRDSFPYPLSTTNMCFHAEVYHCGPVFTTAQTCIQVDPKPVCGYITGLPYNNPTNLTLTSIVPWPTYEICPGNDAIVGINPTTPFTNCNPQWQYSLDPFPFNWIDIGFSNPAQNTNILPAHFTPPWSPSQQNIYYRIACRPLSNPSGCAPCLSNNIIEIRLKPVLSKPVISCNPASQIICYGGTATLTVALDPQVTQWTWYCNGAVVGTGPSVIVDKKACYWVEATDGCSTVKSDPLCLDVCTVFAIITCPEDNPCAIPNLPVTMSGISSYSTCGFIDQYDWEVEDLPSGTTHFYSGPTVTFTPPPAGAIVMLTVTDSNGCIHSAQGFIKPCQP